MTKDRKIKLVHLGGGVYVNPITPISYGMEVIIRQNGDYNFEFGGVSEDIGVVTGYEPKLDGQGQVTVQIGKKKIYKFLEHNVVAYTDYLRWKHENNIVDPTPKFKIDQVVFVLSSLRPKQYIYGDVFNTKILKTEVSKFGNIIRYLAHLPNIGNQWFMEHELISVEDKEKLFNNIKEYTFNTDALPFFHKGQRVKVFDGYLMNLDESVGVKLNDTLLANLSEVKD